MLQHKRASTSGAGKWAALAPLLLVIFMLAAAVPRQAAAAMFVGDDDFSWRLGSCSPSVAHPSVRFSGEKVCVTSGRWHG
jgi:hypothetical protein